ncbi:MAG: radical SAM protein, partial [Eubacteriales bacterium]|nr:radical SAM protein [Eubacteriales bacterium]
DAVIENIKIAKQYIPMVGIETPMTPEFYAVFGQKKEAILATGLDFINCAELHLNDNNLENYLGENLYMARLGYVSPIWSRELTLRLMKTAAEEHWPIVVHDCSNETKFARDLNLRAREGGWFGSSSYACEFERIPFAAFLPVLQDENFTFLQEEELPRGYRPGELSF